MNIPVKTLKSGYSLPVYGLGTWHINDHDSVSRADSTRDISAIQQAIELGITHIDTAESYGDGYREQLVGQAIAGFDRQKLFITTKVSATNQAYDDLLRSCEQSLKRLNTDYIDLYLLHRFPLPGIDIAATMRAMDKLVSDGVVKNIGVCNLTVNRFIEAQKHTANKLVCNQVEYNLQQRAVENRGILKHCQENDIFLIAWGPLALGKIDRAAILQDLAKKYDKTPNQIALNWLISQDNVVTIPKTSNTDHLKENLGALGWELSAVDMRKLTKDFPNQTTVSDRVPLDYEADVPA